MSKVGSGRAGLVASAWCTLALASCGGETKQAESPGTCPEGTFLKGADCLPVEGPPNDKAAGDKSASDKAASDKAPEDSTPQTSPKTPVSEDKSEDHAPSAPAHVDSVPAGKMQYDKEAVDAQLKRGARQVKANCGAATDDEGKATGPWGKTKASITLGRNGHVKQVSVPAPYDGKPAGLCVVHAFEKIQFPPYPGESDVVVDWDVELVRPKH
ncbi:MAG TPA: hypothetical protein VGY54_19810 [Polyangiaceae bacterium]|jgi:hypothetical protein|nr:hypothetical protein [Polyangiaceae bacterium]